MNNRTPRSRHLKWFSTGTGRALAACALLAWTPALQAQTQELIASYIESWTDFYPSSAFGQGDKQSALRFEDFSGPRLSAWLDTNRHAERTLSCLQPPRSMTGSIHRFS